MEGCRYDTVRLSGRWGAYTLTTVVLLSQVSVGHRIKILKHLITLSGKMCHSSGHLGKHKRAAASMRENTHTHARTYKHTAAAQMLPHALILFHLFLLPSRLCEHNTKLKKCWLWEDDALNRAALNISIKRDFVFSLNNSYWLTGCCCHWRRGSLSYLTRYSGLLRC